MKYKTFQPRFHEAIRNETKTSTMRPYKGGSASENHQPKHGEIISLRGWEGQPYRSPMMELGKGRIMNRQIVRLTERDGQLEAFALGGSIPDQIHAGRLATLEGFKGPAEMLKWFKDNHCKKNQPLDMYVWQFEWELVK